MATTWFLPALLDPATQMSPTVLLLPPRRRCHSSYTSLPGRAPRLCGWQLGVHTAGVGGLAAPRSLHEGAASERACLAEKEGERRRRGGWAGEGEPVLSPRVAIFSQAI